MIVILTATKRRTIKCIIKGFTSTTLCVVYEIAERILKYASVAMLNQLELQTSINLTEWGIDVFFCGSTTAFSFHELYKTLYWVASRKGHFADKINLMSSTIIYVTFLVYDNITMFTSSLGIREKSNI